MVVTRCLAGSFRRMELKWYLAAEAAIFWGLVLLCFFLVPPENKFGFASHPFSYLGGFDPEHNPDWWWVFSAAMLFWAVSYVPVVFYIRRRFAAVSPGGSWRGAAWLLFGCLGILLVGLVPTGHDQFWGSMSHIGAHRYCSVPILVGFGFGTFWHELMLFRDWRSGQRLRGGGYGKFVALYAAWWGLVFCGVWFLARWPFVYERMRAGAAAAGKPLQGSWTEALNTVYSIPLWENILIITLYLFMVCLPLMLPGEVPAGSDTKGLPARAVREKRRRRPYFWTRLLLGLFLLVLVAVIAVAKALPRPQDNGEITGILEGAAADRLARAEAVARARAVVPEDAAVSSDWDYRPLLAEFRGGRLEALLALASSYTEEPSHIPPYHIPRIRQALGKHGPASPPGPFHFPFDLDGTPQPETLARLGDFLRRSQPLTEVKAAVELGLFQDIVDVYRNPLEADVVSMVVLLAGRAMGELLAGEAATAADTLLAGYQLTWLCGDWPHYYGHSHWYFGNKVLDRVLWRVVDAAPPDDALRKRLLDAMDARKPVDRLGRALLIQAANTEIGEESEHRGYPQPVNLGFAFAGREAMARMKQFVPLLAQPPWRTRGEAAAIGAHVVGGYWINRLLDGAVQAYKLHSREAVMGDIIRLAFALKAWRDAHGAYPASLGELQPPPLAEMPTEPLTGEPLQYEATPATFVIRGPADNTVWPEMYWVARN